MCERKRERERERGDHPRKGGSCVLVIAMPEILRAGRRPTHSSALRNGIRSPAIFAAPTVVFHFNCGLPACYSVTRCSRALRVFSSRAWIGGMTNGSGDKTGILGMTPGPALDIFIAVRSDFWQPLPRLVYEWTR